MGGAAQAAEYKLVYSGATTWNDINNKNVAVGETLYQPYFGFTQALVATVWKNGAATDISASLGRGYFQAIASGINDAGVIAGETSGTLPGTPGAPFPNGAFRYSGSGPLQNADFLGAVQPGEFALGAAINNHGVVVGVSGNGPDNVAFATTPGGAIGAGSSLGTLGGPRSSATAVNDAGLIVGNADTTLFSLGQPAEHAFAYDTSMHDLGTLSQFSASISNATGVNASGAIVGFSDTDFGREAFLHIGLGPLQASDALGTLGGSQSYGLGVNDQGEVVGSSSFDNITGRQHAFIYRSGHMIDLNSLVDLASAGFAGWELLSANGINDNGWIIGSMALGVNQSFGFILAPTDAVPEPAGWAVLLAGLGVLSVALRRRRRVSSIAAG